MEDGYAEVARGGAGLLHARRRSWRLLDGSASAQERPTVGRDGNRRSDSGGLSESRRTGHRAGAGARSPGRGGKDAVIPGLELQVYREGQEFKHPYTGQILGKLDRDVGRVRVLEVQPNFSVAEVIQHAEGTMVSRRQGARDSGPSHRWRCRAWMSPTWRNNTRSVTRDLANALIRQTGSRSCPTSASAPRWPRRR